MDSIMLLAVGATSIVALVALLFYIRGEKGKLRRSVLRYERIRKKLEEDRE